MNLLVRCVASTLLASVLVLASQMPVAPAGAANGEVKTDKSCKPGKYKSSYRVTSAAEAPEVTHVKGHGISPGGTRTISRTAKWEQTLRARAAYRSSAEIGASGIAKVLAKAEARLNVNLAVAGSATRSKSIKVTDTVSNPTKQNKIFVFYRGYTHAKGQFRYYFCKIYYLPGQNYGPAFVTYRKGSWSSYRVEQEGALRCGAGSGGNAVAAAALRLGCP